METPKITGQKPLTDDQIAAMNEIKEASRNLISVIDKYIAKYPLEPCWVDEDGIIKTNWIYQGRTMIQTGVMMAVRGCTNNDNDH